ncbi:MAG: zraS 2 [Spartobacteria bacterium]|nr:zraS 2 [Spartobacteria bacterium]
MLFPIPVLASIHENVTRIDGGLTTTGQPPASPSHGCFRDNDLLVTISEETYAQVASKIDLQRFAPDQVIFEENDTGDCLYLIAQGSVKISKKGRAGQQETLAYLLERDFFGEMALVDSGKRSAQAAAVGHVILGRIDRAGWDLLLRLAPHEVLGNFTKSVTKRLRQNNQNFIEQMMRNERLSLIGTTISSIVHDMNNPISCILGACDIIRSKNQDEVVAQMAKLIREAVGKMDTMTRELIDFSRGKTNLTIRSISVGEFIHNLESDFVKCRPIVDVRIEALYDGPIHIDRHRLLRVFGNLIRNAREAMAETERKTLQFTVKRLDSKVRFELADTGCGISSNLLPKIFEPFMTHGKSNGTGLGLAVSKAVIDAHGGSISATSNEFGTTFQIDLPLEA